MTALDRLVSTPRMIEIDHVDLAAPPARVWELVRHGDIARSPFTRALFAIRTLPDLLLGRPRDPSEIHIDQLRSTPEHPGFQVLADDPPREIAVGAIGKVWLPDIPFIHVASAAEYAAFATAGYAKVAWAIRVMPRGERDSRVEVEVRVDATDEEAWKKFRRYFRFIGPGSHFIRRAALSALAHDLGDPNARENERVLPGDELLSDAAGQITRGITIRATPRAIWPWLVQMGCRRAGFYAIDELDNGGVASAREIHPDWQTIEIGEVLRATPDGDDGFEVLRVDAPRAFILGGLYDGSAHAQLAFGAPRPKTYWHVTWSFVLEPLDATTTRLHVRARAAFSPSESLHVAWIRPVHRLMQDAQLRHLAARAEDRLPADRAADVLEGIGGAAAMAMAILMPFLRGARSHWGLDEASAARALPGDALVASPRWSWTHAVEIDAPVAAVWPWVAQIGAGRGGFYSYQWLENVAGCHLQNAEAIHPEWEAHVGDALVLHPGAPSLPIVEVGESPDGARWLVAHGAPDEAARAAGKSWAAGSWLFYVEPLAAGRCRMLSRFRSTCSDDLGARVAFGPTLLEPIGFVMDRRMLLGVKERAEKAASRRTAPRASAQRRDARARDGTAMATNVTMSTKKSKHEDTAEETAAHIHQHEKRVEVAIATASGASMAAVGAAIGSIAGPPGAIAGAMVGAAIGAATSVAMEREQHRESRRVDAIDREIGVTSGPLGAAPVANVPPARVPPSAEVLDEMEAAVSPGSRAR